jgi:hypothetical protein
MNKEEQSPQRYDSLLKMFSSEYFTAEMLF